MDNFKKKKKFKYLYGPVSSWRLGSSLGIDLLFGNEKMCSFNCVYCQIGETPEMTKERRIYAKTEEVIEEIKTLPPDLRIDYITFSGRGEPTLASNLGEVIKEIKALRKEKIAVITNSSLMWDESVRGDLSLADFVMAKLDTASKESFQRINRPQEDLRFEDVYKGIESFRKKYTGRLAIQIMLFDMNKNEFKKLAELAFRINPYEIQINTPLRPCAISPLSKKDIKEIREYFEEFGKGIKSAAKIISVYDAEHKKVSPISRKDTLRRRGKAV